MNDPVRIDLNADLGEGDAHDLELLQVISSCNVACGGHAGDAASMASTVQHAISAGVSIGAHPAYPDRAGFGRLKTTMPAAELRVSLVRQISDLQSIVRNAGSTLTHVKPHGALYNDVAKDADLAELLIAVVCEVCEDAAIVGPPGSALQAAARNAGLAFVAEAFVDRGYLPNGRLVPRSEPGAVHTSLNTITSQALGLAKSRQVTAQNGAVISVAADTLCIHGDTPNAGVAARAVRDVLQASGFDIRAPD